LEENPSNLLAEKEIEIICLLGDTMAADVNAKTEKTIVFGTNFDPTHCKSNRVYSVNDQPEA